MEPENQVRDELGNAMLSNDCSCLEFALSRAKQFFGAAVLDNRLDPQCNQAIQKLHEWLTKCNAVRTPLLDALKRKSDYQVIVSRIEAAEKHPGACYMQRDIMAAKNIVVEIKKAMKAIRPALDSGDPTVVHRFLMRYHNVLPDEVYREVVDIKEKYQAQQNSQKSRLPSRSPASEASSKVAADGTVTHPHKRQTRVSVSPIRGRIEGQFRGFVDVQGGLSGTMQAHLEGCIETADGESSPVKLSTHLVLPGSPAAQQRPLKSLSTPPMMKGADTIRTPAPPGTTSVSASRSQSCLPRTAPHHHGPSPSPMGISPARCLQGPFDVMTPDSSYRLAQRHASPASSARPTSSAHRSVSALPRMEQPYSPAPTTVTHASPMTMRWTPHMGTPTKLTPASASSGTRLFADSFSPSPHLPPDKAFAAECYRLMLLEISNREAILNEERRAYRDIIKSLVIALQNARTEWWRPVRESPVVQARGMPGWDDARLREEAAEKQRARESWRRHQQEIENALQLVQAEFAHERATIEGYEAEARAALLRLQEQGRGQVLLILRARRNLCDFESTSRLSIEEEEVTERSDVEGRYTFARRRIMIAADRISSFERENDRVRSIEAKLAKVKEAQQAVSPVPFDSAALIERHLDITEQCVRACVEPNIERLQRDVSGLQESIASLLRLGAAGSRPEDESIQGLRQQMKEMQQLFAQLKLEGTAKRQDDRDDSDDEPPSSPCPSSPPASPPPASPRTPEPSPRAPLTEEEESRIYQRARDALNSATKREHELTSMLTEREERLAMMEREYERMKEELRGGGLRSRVNELEAANRRLQKELASAAARGEKHEAIEQEYKQMMEALQEAERKASEAEDLRRVVDDLRVSKTSSEEMQKALRAAEEKAAQTDVLRKRVLELEAANEEHQKNFSAALEKQKEEWERKKVFTYSEEKKKEEEMKLARLEEEMLKAQASLLEQSTHLEEATSRAKKEKEMREEMERRISEEQEQVQATLSQQQQDIRQYKSQMSEALAKVQGLEEELAKQQAAAEAMRHDYELLRGHVESAILTVSGGEVPAAAPMLGERLEAVVRALLEKLSIEGKTAPAKFVEAFGKAVSQLQRDEAEGRVQLETAEGDQHHLLEQRTLRLLCNTHRCLYPMEVEFEEAGERKEIEVAEEDALSLLEQSPEIMQLFCLLEQAELASSRAVTPRSSVHSEC